MQNLALVTVYFEYPDYAMPCFFNKARSFFKKDDIHIMRFSDPSMRDKNLYEKLYFYKTVKGLEYIKTNILGKYEYMIFADAKDTNFYRDPSDIINTFHTFDCSILFCSEKCFWPPVGDKNIYDKKEKLTDSFYLNSGLYIGYTDKIVYHMEQIIQHNRTVYDDQGHWTLEYLCSDDIKLDQHKRVFFSTLDSKSEVGVIDSKIVLPTNPFMVHDNGPYNDNTLKLADKL